MNHIMLDLETMGTRPDAALTVIGAVKFDPRTGALGETFEAKIDPFESVAAGGTVDKDTLAWWSDQAPEVRWAIEPGGTPLCDALNSFRAFAGFGTDGSLSVNLRLWGNGAAFDCAILRGAYQRMDMTVPWDHWQDRDVRTIVDLGRTLAGVDPKKTLDREGLEHCAVDDAIFQARYVCEIYKALGIREAA